jgi:hypothetical protein
MSASSSPHQERVTFREKVVDDGDALGRRKIRRRPHRRSSVPPSTTTVASVRSAIGRLRIGASVGTLKDAEVDLHRYRH